MSGVSPEMIEGLLRSNFNNLQSFAEQLNAELTEEGQEEESRQSHMINISQILQRMTEVERYFTKSRQCIDKVSAEINKHLLVDQCEDIDHSDFINSIKNVIRVIEGKDKDSEDGDDFRVGELDDGKVIRLLEQNKEILDEFNPLKFEEDNNTEEEVDRICEWLDEKIKKSMAVVSEKLLKDPEEDGSRLEERENSQIVDSDDETDVELDPNIFVQVPQSKVKDFALINEKLEHSFNQYKEKIVREPPVNAKELFDNEMKNTPDPKLEQLKFASKYNSSILELFSKEAIVVVSGKATFVDPVTKMKIVTPVRNKICQHVYERDTMYGLLKNKKKMPCPFLGCSNRSFSLADLEEDEDLTAQVTQSRAREQERQDSVDEDEETDREDIYSEIGSEDDTQSQVIL